MTECKIYVRAFMGNKNQLELLHNALILMKNIKIINDESKGVTKVIKCITGWQITIRNTFDLWDSLKLSTLTFYLQQA